MTTCRSVEFTARVCGGFPVNVRASIAPAEPDVGIFTPWVDDLEITTLCGKPAPWLKISEKEIDRLHEEAMEAAMESNRYEDRGQNFRR